MDNAVALIATSRPDTTLSVTQGAARLLLDTGGAALMEMRLKNGRRADLVALDAKGRFTIVEVKSCREDFEADSKWRDYLEFTDQFFFAVAEDFPQALLPEDEGLIIADQFGGAVVRPSAVRKMAPARRKAMTLAFARQSAFSALRTGPLVLSGEWT